MWNKVGDWFGDAWDFTSGIATGVFDTATGLLTGVAGASTEISSRVGETFESLARQTARQREQQQETAGSILSLTQPNIIIIGALVLIVIIVSVSRS